MNYQHLFDTVLTELRAQGRAAKVDVKPSDGNASASRCMYRAPRGLKCALGHLFPDSLYVHRMEGQGIDGPHMADVRDYLGVRSPENMKFLELLQQAHDQAMPADGDPRGVAQWEMQMERIASIYRLNFARLPSTTRRLSDRRMVFDRPVFMSHPMPLMPEWIDKHVSIADMFVYPVSTQDLADTKEAMHAVVRKAQSAQASTAPHGEVEFA